MNGRELIEQFFFGLVYFGGEEGGTFIVWMIFKHEGSVSLFYCQGGGSLVDSKDQLGLSSVHLGIEASWEHAVRIDVLFGFDEADEAAGSSDG